MICHDKPLRADHSKRYLHCPFSNLSVAGEKLREVQVLAVRDGQLLAGHNQIIVQLLPHLLDKGAQVADKAAGNGAVAYIIINIRVWESIGLQGFLLQCTKTGGLAHLWSTVPEQWRHY